MSEYGAFASIVATAGCLVAAAGAIKLSWMERAKWQPPEETVPAAVAKLSGVISVVVVASLYVFGPEIGRYYLFGVAIIFTVLSILALVMTISLVTRYVYYYPTREVRLLGGAILTDEAAAIKKKYATLEQQMLEHAQGDKYLVWTRHSVAMVAAMSTCSFIALITCGTSAVATAAMLVLVAQGAN